MQRLFLLARFTLTHWKRRAKNNSLYCMYTSNSYILRTFFTITSYISLWFICLYSTDKKWLRINVYCVQCTYGIPVLKKLWKCILFNNYDGGFSPLIIHTWRKVGFFISTQLLAGAGSARVKVPAHFSLCIDILLMHFQQRIEWLGDYSQLCVFLSAKS